MMRFFYNRLNKKGTSRLLYSLICIVHLLLLPPASLSAEDNLVSARLTPHNFSTQQPARLAITIEGKQDAQITMPEVEGLIFHQRGQSSQFQMVNGTSSYSVTYTYLVQATEPGDYTIPPIAITTRKGAQTTKPISFTVADTPATVPRHKQSQSSPVQRVTGEQNENVAFIRLIPAKEKAYVGELIPTTIKAYFYRGVKFKFNALPELSGEGFLMDALSNEPQQQEEIIDGNRYMVLTWDTVLTGIKEGKNDLSMEMDVSMLVRSPQQNRRLPGFGGRLQDDFFDDFLGRYENQPVKVTSSAVNMDVTPLPEQGKPNQFSGAIGSFTMDMQAQPTNIAPGDPVTLTMSITGTGNFDNVSTPSLTEADGIKIYSPTSSFHKGNQQEADRKVFEQAIVITDPEVNQIPPAVFSYFDPIKEQYQTLFTDPILIHVSGPSPAAGQPQPLSFSQKQTESGSSPESDLPFAGLAPVKLTPAGFTGDIKPLFRQPLFLLASLLLLTAIAGVTAYRIRTHFLAKNPGIVHRRRIENQRKSCINAINGIKSTDQTTYLSSAQQNLRNFLAILWGCEAASITTADIKKHLGAEHPITRLFSHGDNASYGAIEFSALQRDQLHKEITEILATLI